MLVSQHRLYQQLVRGRMIFGNSSTDTFFMTNSTRMLGGELEDFIKPGGLDTDLERHRAMYPEGDRRY